MFCPSISASTVASLIGLNPYRPRHESMYAVMRKETTLKERMTRLENENQLVQYEAIRRKLAWAPEVRHVVNLGVREAQTNQNIPAIVERAGEAINTVARMRFPTIPDDVREALVKECASDIQKQRGLQNEDAVLNEYESTTQTIVTQRNTCMRYANCGTYKLCGRIDGYVESLNRIVDSKERTRHWPSVPIYDEIQMRVYMELMECPEAELVERFPNGKTRNTVYTRDAAIWKTIHDSLEKVAAEMRDAASSDELLLKIIEANTFKDVSRPIPNASNA